MNYVAYINQTLVPKKAGPLVVDLFAGCGGLALGFEAQGFETHGFEMDTDACATYNKNLLGECKKTKLTIDTPLPEARVLIGGPPCQPYSVAGHQLGLNDARDGFPIFLSAVRRLRPDLFLIENVRGMLYRNRGYLDEIVAALRDLGYLVEQPRLMNAVHFGVPQNRERVIIVGHQGIFKFPEHVRKSVTAGEAVGDLATKIVDESKIVTSSMDRYIAAYEKKSCCIRPRDLHMDRPSRTLTCRNLAGATADMMRVRLDDGRRRRLTVTEAARLQSFPDSFVFTGSENRQFYQLGNAVAPLFAYHVAGAVKNYLVSELRFSAVEIEHMNCHHRAAEQLSLVAS